MKKSKLLIPALSLAGVGAIVTPMMTLASCGNKVYVSTDKIDFTGDQHTAVTGGWTIAQATEDYFKDEKHFANDILSAAGFVIDLLNDSLNNTRYYTNYKVESYYVELSNYSFAQKEAKVDYRTIAFKDTIKGALVSGRLTGYFTVSYDRVLDTAEKEMYSKIHREKSINFDFSFKDCFAFIGKNIIPNGEPGKKDWEFKNGFSLNIFGVEDASKDWKIEQYYSQTLKEECTTLSGEVVTETTKGDAHALYTCKAYKNKPFYPQNEHDGLQEFSYLPSSYLAKVAFKKEDMPMNYREDVYVSKELKGYFGNPIVLNAGEEITFYADIKATDKINTIGFFTDSYPYILTIKSVPVVKLGTSTVSGWTWDSTNYVYVNSTPITTAGRLSITFALPDATTEPMVAIPYAGHNE